MLIRLSIKNIRKSIKDYAIYFFTLVLGVCIFYVFNAIEGQSSIISYVWKLKAPVILAGVFSYIKSTDF